MRQLTSMPRSGTRTLEVAAPPVIVRQRLGKLCVAIRGETPAELFQRAAGLSVDSRFVEFRLDSLAKPAAALPALKAFMGSHRDFTAIATCRRKQLGGGFTGALTAEL